MASLLASSSPSLSIYGHPRKGWDVADVKAIPGLEKLRTSRGVFAVLGGDGVIVRMSMERPFKDLREADLGAMAEEIKVKVGA